MEAIPNAIGAFQLQVAGPPSFGVISAVGLNVQTGLTRKFRLIPPGLGHGEAQLRALGSLLESVSVPGLERLVDHGEVDRHYYYAFEHEASEPWADFLARKPEPSVLLALTQGLAQAVETLHAFGLAHGNLQAESLRVTQGPRSRLVLVDLRLDLALQPVEAVGSVRAAIEGDQRQVRALIAETLPPDLDTGMDATVAPDTRRLGAAPLSPPASAPVAEGSALPDRYTVQREIARGGMGIILDAQDRELRREVALKVLLAGLDDESVRARFVEEAQVQGQLEHPNICPVHDIGIDAQGRPYFTMKKVRGVSLAAVVQRMRSGIDPANLGQLLTIFVKVCDAVAFAHSRGVIHRDLKPANVMVGAFGEVQVMDWGIAKLGRRADVAGTDSVSSDRQQWSLDQTRAGSAMGTPVYMAPEQFVAAEAVDVRADVYSLGAMLYELLTFAVPVEAKNLAELMVKVRQGEIRAPSVRSPERAIPRDLEAATRKAMSVQREQRYDSAGALRDDVEAYLDGRTLAAAEYSPFERATKWARRNRVFVSTALVAVLIWSLSSAFYLVRLLRANEAIGVQLASAVLSEGRASMAALRPGEGRAAFERVLQLAPAGSPTHLKAKLELWKGQSAAPDPLLVSELGFAPTSFATVGGQGRVLVGGLGRVELWDALAGQRLATLAVGSTGITRLSTGVHGRHFLAQDQAGALFIGDLQQSQVRSLPGQWKEGVLLEGRGEVKALDLDGYVHTLGVADGSERSVDEGQRVKGLAAAQDESWIVARDGPNQLHLERSEPGQGTVIFRSSRVLAEPMALDAGAQRIAVVLEGRRELGLIDVVAGGAGQVQLMDALDPKAVLRGQQAPVTALSWSANRSWLLSSDEGGEALLWDLSDRTVRRHFSGGRGQALFAGFSAQDALVVGVSGGGQLLVWAAEGTPGQMHGRDRALSAPSALGYSRSGDLIWSYSTTEELFARATGRYLAVRNEDQWQVGPRTQSVVLESAGKIGVGPAALSSDGSMVGMIVGGTLRRWSIESTPRKVEEQPLPAGGQYTFLALGDAGTTAVAYRVAERGQLFWLDAAHPQAQPLGPPLWSRGPAVLQASKLAVGGGPGTQVSAAWRQISVFDLAAPDRAPLVLPGHEGAATGLAFAPDGRTLFSTGADRTLRAWSLAEARSLFTVVLPDAGRSLAVEPRGRGIAVGLTSGAVVLFDFRGGELLRFSALAAPVVSATFSRDGELLVGGQDGSLAVFQPFTRPSLLDHPSAGLEQIICQDGGAVAHQRGLPTVGWCPLDPTALAGLPPLDREVLPAPGSGGSPPLAEAQLRLIAHGRERELQGWLAEHPEALGRVGGELLLEAILVRNDRAADLLLEAGVNPGYAKADGTTPLLMSTTLGLADRVESLLSAGAVAYDGRGPDPVVILAYAPWAERPAIATRLAQGRAVSGEAATEAVANDNVWMIEALARSGQSLEAPTSDVVPTTPLIKAVLGAQPLVVERLLGAGVNPNRSDGRSSPLVAAALRNDRSLVSMLLQKGADPNLQAPNGRRPLTAAMLGQDPYPTVRTLLDAGADPGLRDAFDRSPLALAVVARQEQVVRTLLGHGAPADQRWGDGSLLHEAVRGGVPKIVRVLCLHGAHQAPDAAGQAPLDLARAAGRPDLVEVLVANAEPPGSER